MISPQTKHLRSVKYLLPIIAVVGSFKLKNHDEPNETISEEKEDEARKEEEKKKKSRLRKRGPYRKAHANW
jgi:hypothetical protein